MGITIKSHTTHQIQNTYIPISLDLKTCKNSVQNPLPKIFLGTTQASIKLSRRKCLVGFDKLTASRISGFEAFLKLVSKYRIEKTATEATPQCALPFLLGVEPATKFLKRGGLIGSQILEGGCARKQGGDLFQRRGCSFYIKNKLWENLTKNLVTFQRQGGVKDEKF